MLLVEHAASGELFAMKALKKGDVLARDELERCGARACARGGACTCVCKGGVCMCVQTGMQNLGACKRGAGTRVCK